MASGASALRGGPGLARPFGAHTMITSKSNGLVLASSMIRRAYFFVWFTGRYAYGRPETLLTH